MFERSLRTACLQVPILLVALLALIPDSARAGAITSVPSGLQPGDLYRIIFVTEGTIDAASPNIAIYNSFVTNAANSDPALRALGSQWFALASTAAVNVLTNASLGRFDTTTRFYNTAGGLIATGVLTPGSGLYGATNTQHLAPIYTQSGSDSDTGGVWTGTGADGSTLLPLGSSLVSMGNAIDTSSVWTIRFGNSFPNGQKHVYGISGVLTVPDLNTPEPASIALTGLALLALGAYRRRSSK